MLCQNCNQKESNVKYTQVINGEKTEMNLCDECAKKLGIGEMSFSMPLSFSNMFGGFSEPDLEIMPKLVMGTILKCEKCGMTYDEFVNQGKFGCDNCYNTFSSKIEPILKRVHGNTQYTGKRIEKNVGKSSTRSQSDETNTRNANHIVPKTKEEQISNLKIELKELVKEEKYEEAAVIRDKIKKLEGGKK